MTRQDLHLLYRQETGEYPPDRPITEDSFDVEPFVEWLEEKLINLYNL